MNWTSLVLTFEQGDEDTFLPDGQEITHYHTSRNQTWSRSTTLVFTARSLTADVCLGPTL